MMQAKCTIYFADPFWVGVFERITVDGYSVARYVFGGEPSDAELYAFVRRDYGRLEFSLPAAVEAASTHEIGYKRRQRLARRETVPTGIGTRAQQALKAERERLAQVHREENHAQREEQEREMFLLRQKRKKQKHKGR